MNHAKKSLVGTLGSRLSLAFIGVLIGAGISVLVVSQMLMRVYFEEFNQKLNASIAMYITEEYQLIHKEGDAPDFAAIQSLAETAMIINPGIEAYVLDTSGKIIGHNFSEESIYHNHVPLDPLKKLVLGKVKYPFKNIDPRQASANKVFTAAEIRSNGQLQGYLYVVLGGAVYDNLEDSLQNSYSRTTGLIAILLIVAAAVVSGKLILNLLVQPLNNLSARMEQFSLNEFSGQGLPEINTINSSPKDEVALLTQTFASMSNQITRQFEMLREADEVKRELISNVSHDLRTPLSSIQGYLETLLIKNNSLSSVERLSYLNTAMKSTRHLGLLVSDLFELSKLESGQVQTTIEPFSLAELVHDIVQEFSLEFEAKKINVDVNNDQKNALVYADISLIQRVFENLIRNAIVHTPERGKISLSISSANTKTQHSLKVSVVDTGCGISPEDLPYIFDRFYTSTKGTHLDVTSTGLGLAIVKRILDLHNSDISVDSQLNQGTRFEFALSQKAA